MFQEKFLLEQIKQLQQDKIELQKIICQLIDKINVQPPKAETKPVNSHPVFGGQT